MNKYAIIETDVVVNVVLWDGDVETWAPAEGQTGVLLVDESVGIGHSYAGGAFTAPPPPPAPVVPLVELQAMKIAEINAACQSSIYAGFTSTALGALYTYPAKSLDQQNLSASVLASLMPGNPLDWTTPFWCADAGGVWDFRAHTAAQIQRCGQDGKAAILVALGKNKMLADQVAASTTADQLAAIVW